MSQEDDKKEFDRLVTEELKAKAPEMKQLLQGRLFLLAGTHSTMAGREWAAQQNPPQLNKLYRNVVVFLCKGGDDDIELQAVGHHHNRRDRIAEQMKFRQSWADLVQKFRDLWVKVGRPMSRRGRPTKEELAMEAAAGSKKLSYRAFQQCCVRLVDHPGLQDQMLQRNTPDLWRAVTLDDEAWVPFSHIMKSLDPRLVMEFGYQIEGFKKFAVSKDALAGTTINQEGTDAIRNILRPLMLESAHMVKLVSKFLYTGDFVKDLRSPPASRPQRRSPRSSLVSA